MHQMILVMAQAMRDAGINVDLQATDWGTVVTRSARNSKPAAGSPGWRMTRVGCRDAWWAARSRQPSSARPAG
jgi:ABC-type transport system substrate-binding protein